MDTQAKALAGPPSLPEQLEQLRTLAKQGDPSAIVRLRTFLATHPEIWQLIGDLAAHVQESLLTLMAGDDTAAVESLRLKMHQLKAELVSESTSPILRLLAEQCVVCWCQVNRAELMLVNSELKGVPPGMEAQKRVSVIQARYLRALSTYANVRRLTHGIVPDKPKLKVVS
jgi:hypothetical protein